MLHRPTPVVNSPLFQRKAGPSCGPMDRVSPPSSVPVSASSLMELRLTQLVLEARVKAQAHMASLVKEQQRQQHLSALLTQTKLLSRNAAVGGHANGRFPRPTMLGGSPAALTPATTSDESSVSSNGSLYFLGDRSESTSNSVGSRGSPSPTTMGQKMYVDTIRDTDILCGRGGRSNHHSGNKRYRHVISEMRQAYKTTTGKTNKTDLSRAIVDHVCSYGGRFIKKEESTGRYYILTRGEARKKTSQALRESKTLKWTN